MPRLEKVSRTPPIVRRRLCPWLVFVVVGSMVMASVATYFVGVRLRLQSSLRAAQQALDLDRLDEAQKHLDLCLQLQPDDIAALLLAARTARRRDDLELAERHLTVLERLKGAHPERVLEQRLLNAQQGDLEAVTSVLEALTAADSPQAPWIFEALTKGYLQRSRSSDAATNAAQLLRCRPESPRTFLLRGKVWDSLLQSPESDEGALAAFRRALELDPELIEARLLLARKLYRMGHTWEAAAHLECVLQQRPESAPAVLLDLARCRRDLNQLGEAERHLQALLARDDKDWAALVELGGLAFHKGETAHAEELLRRAAASAPPFERAPYRPLCLVLARQGKMMEAESYRQRDERIEAEEIRLEQLVARAQKSPGDAALLHKIGMQLVHLGRKQESLSWFFGALEIDSRYAPAHAALANHFERVGQRGRAARHRQVATESRP